MIFLGGLLVAGVGPCIPNNFFAGVGKSTRDSLFNNVTTVLLNNFFGSLLAPPANPSGMGSNMPTG